MTSLFLSEIVLERILEHSLLLIKNGVYILEEVSIYIS